MSATPRVYTIHVGRLKGGYEEEAANSAVQVRHANAQRQSSRAQSLLPQLANIPKNAESLILEHDVPTDEEWMILGSHFSAVQNLEVEAGHNEFLNDQLVPNQWPLGRLLISSSGGEVSRNPHILLGKVRHLIFFLTMGIRFEGPTSEELMDAHERAVQQGEHEEHHVGETGVKITYLPQLADEWMSSKYAGKEIVLSSATTSTNPNVHPNTENLGQAKKDQTPALDKVEIIENDALDLFSRFTLALPHLMFNLRTLNIRSTNGCDLNSTPDGFFGYLLSQLTQLETLVLTLGEVFDEDDTLPTIYQSFPDNIRILRFRGPVALTQSTHWTEWITNFGNPMFLPKLECLSFVCDIGYGKAYNVRRPEKQATLEEFRQSKERCQQLLAAVRDREGKPGGKKVVIEPFIEQWHSQCPQVVEAVYPTWDTI